MLKYGNFRLFAGVLLFVIGLLMFSSISVGVISGGYNDNSTDLSFLAFAFMFFFLPFFIIGAVFFWSGLRKSQTQYEEDLQQRLVDMITVRAKVPISELARELRVDEKRVRDLIYIVVGRKRFTGYIQWQEGILYSDEASHLLETQQCVHCGGKITIAGKGIVVCKYCDTEIFVN